MPTSMKALILDSGRRTASVKDVARPVAGDGEVLIKVNAVALIPVDALYVYHPLGQTGRIVGSDFAGTVESVHTSESSRFQVGNRVAGFLQGACSVNERPGAFAEYVICPADLVWRIPPSVGMEKASTISLCALTAAQALFFRIGLPAPFDWGTAGLEKTTQPLCIFIYGASSSVALYAAQLVPRSADLTEGLYT